jgi:predicted MarR family transcription regulator
MTCLSLVEKVLKEIEGWGPSPMCDHYRQIREELLCGLTGEQPPADGEK